jgi:L-aminopeptidase/D-esterase-like protein
MDSPCLNLLTDVSGLKVGHATDLALGSGVTAIVFDAPAIASGLALGGAPGGRDTGLLDPEMCVEHVDAFVLSGGSAFGLDAAGGVQAALREARRGFHLGGGVHVPIVPQAILMDLLNGGNKEWGRFPPYRDLGYEAACTAAGGAFALGSVGAGTGATTATVKGGLGSASAVTQAGHTVAALVAVNAVGSALVGPGPHFWAAPFEVAAEFGGVGWPTRLNPDDLALRAKGEDAALCAGRVTAAGTTIGLAVTDAILTKMQARRLAIAAHDGLARAVFPAHLPMDGDTMFAASTGRRPLYAPTAELNELCHMAALVTARAIARGVYEATALPVADAQPAWQDLFGAAWGVAAPAASAAVVR